MPITVRDRAPRQRNIASLVGGYVIAAGCFVLALLVASELGVVSWLVVFGAAVFAGVIGVWIRVADL